MLSKFLDPRNDFAFRKLFASEKNQDILIHFINDILGFKGPEQIQTADFLKIARDPDISWQKKSLVDVLCKDRTGQELIVQMRAVPVSMQGFEKYAQRYASRAYNNQSAQGEDYTNHKKIIFIAITDFLMFENKEGYYSTHVVLEKEPTAHDLKDFSFTVLELPKFDKKIEELETLLEKWVYFFKYAAQTKEADVNRIAGSDQVINRAYEAVNQFSWTEIELNAYEREEKSERDARAILAQQRIDIAEARNLIRAGESNTAIEKALGFGLSLEVIEALRQQMCLE